MGEAGLLTAVFCWISLELTYIWLKQELAKTDERLRELDRKIELHNAIKRTSEDKAWKS